MIKVYHKIPKLGKMVAQIGNRWYSVKSYLGQRLRRTCCPMTNRELGRSDDFASGRFLIHGGTLDWNSIREILQMSGAIFTAALTVLFFMNRSTLMGMRTVLNEIKGERDYLAKELNAAREEIKALNEKINELYEEVGRLRLELARYEEMK